MDDYLTLSCKLASSLAICGKVPQQPLDGHRCPTASALIHPRYNADCLLYK